MQIRTRASTSVSASLATACLVRLVGESCISIALECYLVLRYGFVQCGGGRGNVDRTPDREEMGCTILATAALFDQASVGQLSNPRTPPATRNTNESDAYRVARSAVVGTAL